MSTYRTGPRSQRVSGETGPANRSRISCEGSSPACSAARAWSPNRQGWAGPAEKASRLRRGSVPFEASPTGVRTKMRTVPKSTAKPRGPNRRLAVSQIRTRSPQRTPCAFRRARRRRPGAAPTPWTGSARGPSRRTALPAWQPYPHCRTGSGSSRAKRSPTCRSTPTRGC